MKSISLSTEQAQNMILPQKINLQREPAEAGMNQANEFFNGNKKDASLVSRFFCAFLFGWVVWVFPI